MLNISPYNPTSAGDSQNYNPPPQNVINEFSSIVKSYDVKVTVRQELGQDVNAACGQLVLDNEKTSCNQDIEDFGKSSKGQRESTTKQRVRGKVPKKLAVEASPIVKQTQSTSNITRVYYLFGIACFLFLLRMFLKFWYLATRKNASRLAEYLNFDQF
jgi:hypothetical protein